VADKSAIEWTGTTWNPVTGCTKVSPGCARCYIERTMPFRMNGHRFVDGSTGLRFHPERLDQPLRWRSPRVVFVNSLSDLFHEEIPDTYIAEVFDVMARASQHTFQVLTKRPERGRDWVARFSAALDRPGPWPLPNVWLGVSIENARFTWRADVLREIPAAVRFISAEPLLGSLFDRQPLYTVRPGHQTKRPLDVSGIDWLIAGGESGPGYRPVRLEWLRELRDACAAAGVAFFFKQWGGARAKSGGRELDERVHDEMPAPYAASAR
jgi:protein gp37